MSSSLSGPYSWLRKRSAPRFPTKEAKDSLNPMSPGRNSVRCVSSWRQSSARQPAEPRTSARCQRLEDLVVQIGITGEDVIAGEIPAVGLVEVGDGGDLGIALGLEVFEVVIVHQTIVEVLVIEAGLGVDVEIVVEGRGGRVFNVAPRPRLGRRVRLLQGVRVARRVTT